MEKVKIVNKEPQYKSEFYEGLNEKYGDLRKQFWKPLNPEYKEPNYETPAQRKQEIMEKNKVVKAHDIWKSATYDSEHWQDWKYKSVYTVDFPNKYEDTLKFNPEIRTKDDNMRTTKISEYSNALHNKGVFVNPRFLSC